MIFRAVAIAVVMTTAALPSVTAGAEPAWSWPVSGDRVVLRPFIEPATPYGPGHRGVDLLATRTGALAPADGVVRFAGMVAGRPVLSIDHGDGVISSFEPVEATVAAGTEVRRGDDLGTILDGHCARRCLHFGVRVDGVYANPLRWLGGAVQPILLPTRTPAAAGPAASDAAVAKTAASVAAARITDRAGPRHRPRARAPATRSARR